MPRKQLNIGLTVEQRTQVDAVAAAEGTTPTGFSVLLSWKPSSCTMR